MENVKTKLIKMILPISVVAFFILTFTFSICNAFTVGVPANFLSLNSGLVGWWTMDGKDVVNGVARDKSDNGNHGNLVNIATSTFYAQGKIGQGFRFDGVDDYVSVGNSTVLAPTTAITISAWVKPLKKVDSSQYSAITSRNATNYLLMIRQDGIVIFYLTGVQSWVTNDGSKDLFDGQWHHIVVTYDGSFQRLYIDNTLINSSAITGNITSNSNTSLIGRDTTGASNYNFNGTLDDVRIYNRALLAQEVQQLYNMGAASKVAASPTASSSPLSTGLVGYWTFDGKDIANGLILDKSGNGNNATSSNIATSTFYVQGKIGQGLKFDGVNDLLSAGQFSSINTISTFTISQWIKTSQNSQVVFAAKLHPTVVGGWDFQTEGTTRQLTLVFYNPTSKGNTPAVINPGIWYHAVAVFDGTKTGNSNRLKIYVNGVDQTLTFTNTIPSAFTTSPAQLTLGGWSGANSWYSGTMDDTRIYNRALSAQEVQQLYNMGTANKVAISPTASSSPLTSGLVGYWTFDGKDVVNGVARDKSGNGNHGNLVNIATSTFYAQGKIGQGFRFDGVDDYVNLDTVTDLSQTYSLWVNTATVPAADVFMFGHIRNSSARFGIGIDSATGNYMMTHYNGSAYKYLSGPSTLGKWTHLVATWDGVNQSSWVFYINGVSNNTVIASNLSNLDNFRRIGTGNGSTFYGGSLDEIRTYNRALSAQEVQQLYNLGR